MEEMIVSPASARGNIDSLGTTGLLNIIDQNQASNNIQMMTSPNENNGQRLLNSRQYVFDRMATDTAFRGYQQASISPSNSLIPK